MAETEKEIVIGRFTSEELGLNKTKERKWTKVANEILDELMEGTEIVGYQTDCNFLSDAQGTTSSILHEMRQIDPRKMRIYCTTRLFQKIDEAEPFYWSLFSFLEMKSSRQP